MGVARLVHRVESLSADGLDHDGIRAAADALLREEIGYDVAAWVTVDPATHLFTSCSVFLPWGPAGPSPEQEAALFASEFADEDPLTFAEFVRTGRVVSRLRAEVEDVTSVERYRTLLQPVGGEDELRAVFRDDTGVWGALILYRMGDAGFFGAADEQAVAALAPHLAAAFRLAFLRAAVGASGVDRPPGSLTVSADGAILTTSEPAERWLDTLPAPEVRGALARVAHDGRRGSLGRCTVVGNEGPVAFHGHPRKGADGEVAVIVEQPRPPQLAEVIMAAHGLTRREAEVTRLVCQGRTTRQLADALAISEYTVQDHLKSVFAKFDVAARSELLHRIYGRFYEPQRERAAVPGPYGFYLDT